MKLTIWIRKICEKGVRTNPWTSVYAIRLKNLFDFL